jgi:hypothetical protein
LLNDHYTFPEQRDARVAQRPGHQRRQRAAPVGADRCPGDLIGPLGGLSGTQRVPVRAIAPPTTICLAGDAQGSQGLDISMTPEEFFAESQLAADVYAHVYGVLERCGDFEVRATRSQVAFRRRRGFAYIWMPGMYLSNPDAEVVLSMTLDHRDDSARFKEVAHPSKSVWQHHLEIQDVSDIDSEVAGWLRDAHGSAG